MKGGVNRQGIKNLSTSNVNYLVRERKIMYRQNPKKQSFRQNTILGGGNDEKKYCYRYNYIGRAYILHYHYGQWAGLGKGNHQIRLFSPDL